jgi:hypothetical protein
MIALIFVIIRNTKKFAEQRFLVNSKCWIFTLFHFSAVELVYLLRIARETFSWFICIPQSAICVADP